MASPGCQPAPETEISVPGAPVVGAMAIMGAVGVAASAVAVASCASITTCGGKRQPDRANIIKKSKRNGAKRNSKLGRTLALVSAEGVRGIFIGIAPNLVKLF